MQFSQLSKNSAIRLSLTYNGFTFCLVGSDVLEDFLKLTSCLFRKGIKSYAFYFGLFDSKVVYLSNMILYISIMNPCPIQRIKPGWKSTVTPQMTPVALYRLRNNCPIWWQQRHHPYGLISSLSLLLHLVNVLLLLYFFLFGSYKRGEAGKEAEQAWLITKGKQSDRLIGKQTVRTDSGRAEGSKGARPPYLPHVTSPSIIPHYHSCIERWWWSWLSDCGCCC